jgi:hypothetical protein
MTQGVLIFAFNNEETDYVAMAEWSAKNICRHLNLPVSIITDSECNNDVFDQVIHAQPDTGGTRYFEDYNQTVTWHNAGRVNAYELTPYDQTLVLDADFVVAGDMLKKVLNMPQDFVCHKNAFNMATGKLMTALNTFGEYNMPMHWATVMMFRKSNTAQYIFDCMQMIKTNWQHYRNLYGIRQSNYRNDFALSIALGIVNGHTSKIDAIPWDLLSVMPGVTLSKFNDPNLESYILEYVDDTNKSKQLSFAGMDFHAMGKKHLEKIISDCC